MKHDTETTVVITLTNDEVDRALETGLVIPHPLKDAIIVFGPGVYSDKIDPECEHVLVCTATKYTEQDIETGARYDHGEYPIRFELDPDRPRYPEQ